MNGIHTNSLKYTKRYGFNGTEAIAPLHWGADSWVSWLASVTSWRPALDAFPRRNM